MRKKRKQVTSSDGFDLRDRADWWRETPIPAATENPWWK